MTTLQRIFGYLLRKATWFPLILLPYYFARFLYESLKVRGLWFYRYPMGHFGSTIPSKVDLLANEQTLFRKDVREIAGIDLNTQYQIALLSEFTKYDRTFVRSNERHNATRYFSDNYSYGSADALILYCMIRHYNPSQIIEIGSGFSSALMLDIKESEAPGLELIFIEPYPATLNRLLSKSDRIKCVVMEKRVQDVPLDVFDSLAPNSILFIDSSHVLKIGSDLSTIIFSILPRLTPGVLVHFHDIFWPLEYPKEMIYKGRIWNEIYIVRSFLQFNDAFEIVLFPSFLQEVHGDILKKALPSYEEFSASGLWLVRKPNPPRARI